MIDSSDISSAYGEPYLIGFKGNDAFSQPRRPNLSSSPQSSEPSTSIHNFRSHSSRSSSFSPQLSPPLRQYPYTHRCGSSPHNRLCKNNNLTSSAPEIPTSSIREYPYHVALRWQHATSSAMRQPDIFPGLSRPSLEKSAGPRCAVRVVRHAVQRAGMDVSILSYWPVSSGQNRDSQGSDSTLRPLDASAGSHVGGLAGQCTFRELGSAPENWQTWASQEKEDEWDGLLERSARAGGTLHLGVGSTQLASDDIRHSSGTLGLET